MRTPPDPPAFRPAGRIVGLLLLLLLCQGSFAQLVVDFSMDQSAGCAPLAVLFNNKTAGASANARYHWDFGNGNTSALHSPGATYRTGQTYTVTLTVTDGGATASKSATIVVYKKPAVDFWTDTKKGCLPLPVEFNSTVDPGDGIVAGLTWDFGNGNVVQGADKSTVTHTFQFAQQPTVSLTATNSYGCFTTVEKTGLLEVLPQVKAGFTLNKKALCATGESVQFTNISDGAVNYQWDFGDGGSSTQAAPSHQYNSAGRYNVTLTASNSDGCTDTLTMPGLVNVANFKNSIEAPPVVCTTAPMTFRAVNSPAADSVRWNFGPGTLAYDTDTATPVFTGSGMRAISLTTYWGGCTTVASVQVAVHTAPVLRGFVQDVALSCGLPYNLQLHDTSHNTISPQWSVPGQSLVAGRDASLSFAAYGQYPVTLTVADAVGCTASITKNIDVVKPEVAIKVERSSSPYGAAGCTGLRVKFKAERSVGLSRYQWSFGDGGTSNVASPEHVFTKQGRYNVVLHYVTATGCADSAFFQEVAVYTKPTIDFTGPAEVCSSNPVGFVASSDTTVRQYYWDYGDGTGFDSVTTIHHFNEHKYMWEGTYTVTLIANGMGGCADTVVKRDFIKVVPPFQAIQNVIPDCGADRNQVYLHLNTRGALAGHWDFGDGQTADAVPAAFQIMPHLFAQPGLYKVKHTSENGTCTAVDSVYVPVPGKQTPRLTATKNFVCLDDTVTISITGVQLLDLSNYGNNPAQYRLAGLRYEDGTPFTGNIQVLDSNWSTGFKAVLSGFGRSSLGLRAFIVSNLTGCVDSTDRLPMIFSGPQAGIQPVAPVCFTSDVVLKDASTGNITSWQWQLGTTALPAQASADPVLFRFAAPGIYPVSLKVTDKDGCYNTFSVPGGIRVLGVKAGFQLPDTVVAINTAVQFTNTSEAISGATVQYNWTYSNGQRTATTTHLLHSYPDIGWDTIRLVARTAEGNCADSLEQVLHHDNIHAKFSYEAAYINNNACPPMLVKFKNRSRNNRPTYWAFGDGGSAKAQNNPEHTYRLGGTYKVTLYTYGPNNLVDSATEYITVKGPSASVWADKYFGCLSQEVQLTAKVAYAKDHYWDFGDGAVLRSRDTSAKHLYLSAGVYTPALVLIDSTGCSVAAELGLPVVIDSLSLDVGGIPALICDKGTVTFEPKAVSIAVDKMNATLSYRWSFGSASSTLATPSRLFEGEGRYPVSVTAVSPYGCVQTAYDTVAVRRTVKGTIGGKPEVCEGSEARFTAAILGTGSTWQWMMPDGQTGTALQSPAVSFQDSGFYPVKLVVNHDGCVDTAMQTLWVHPAPVVRFANPLEHVCRGTAATLQAGGGVQYRWSGTEPILLGAALNRPVVFPQKTTWYRVLVTSPFGCQSTDSVQVRVTQPFKMAALSDTFVCRGSSVALQASGAYTYRWSGPAGTLRNETDAMAIVAPTSAARYRVIGTDSAQCFTDTAFAHVRIEELPFVQAGPDLTVLTGGDVTLAARTSPDVVRYEWLPKEAVQCSSCVQTVAAPRKPTSYSLTVTNGFGCIAKDTVNISLQCTESRVHIPNAFTPDHNGLNETFSIRGRGATVKSFRIFDRWGSTVFGAANVQLNDARGAWDGNYNGRKAPAGTYVYVAELICDTGEPFIRKGTVTLVR